MARNFEVKLNPSAKRQLEKEAARKFQPEVDRQIQSIVRDVRNEMDGQSAGRVYNELTKRLTKAGVQPNKPNLRKVANEIEAGTLSG